MSTWRCHRCSTSNPAHQDQCRQCGAPAVSGLESTPSGQTPPPERAHWRKSPRKGALILLGLVVFALLVKSPWLYRLAAAATVFLLIKGLLEKSD